MRQKTKRLVVGLAAITVIITLVSGLLTYSLLRMSLPQLDGEVVTEGVSEEVKIERDAAGIPLITAANRVDLAFATGYVHGQDRFFQMDLTRRNAAGELSELFGPAVVEVDRHHRFHRFRARANDLIEQLTQGQDAILEAYTHGVNAGLTDLDAKPFEYFLTATQPRSWKKADTILTIYAMYLQLNDARAMHDIRRGLAQRNLPEAVFTWLYPQGTTWDAPLQGSPRETTPYPGPEVYNLHGTALAEVRSPYLGEGESLMPGSNNWAVMGMLTANGRAIVANDMHLNMTTPNVFYRARMRSTDTPAVDLTGVTLPGTPFLVAGSNGRIAWGNTNSYGDWSDAIIVKPAPDPDMYMTPQGPRAFTVYHETIRIKGAEPVEFEIRETIWGPVLDDDPDPDRMLAVSWIAHRPEAINLNHVDLETASTVDEALAIANRLGMPPQNFVVGDADGNIGWTIAGRIPVREGYNPLLPADWSKSGGWTAWLKPEDYPRITNPDSGRIWTANARVVDDKALALIGDGGYDLGARARQIRDGLFAIKRYEPENMLPVQLDDRAIFLGRWRDLLLETLNGSSVNGSKSRSDYRRLVDEWVPRASTDSVGYRLVRAFRNEVRNRVFTMLIQPVLETFGEETRLHISNQFEGPLWLLVNEKPAHLLTDNYASWDDLLLQAVDSNIEYFEENYSDGLARRTWGERNTARITHPLSRALPFLSTWLDMPADPLPGDSNLPRAQGPTFGAAERFAVSPGDEANGYLHMPAGQSGHPLSEYYRIGHDDWVHGRPTAFLPGEPVHTLVMKPIR
jgi:penicillin amidase